jgi:hypothetical protein
MPEAPHAPTKGIGGILKSQTGPLPNWVWLLVIGGGIAAAIIVPKLLAKGSTTAADATTTDAGTPNSGLGLAVDPTTGLPYAVEGLVPSGGTVATQSGLPPVTTPVAATPTPAPATPSAVSPLVPAGTSIPDVLGAQYEYAGQWYTIVPGPQNRIWGVLGQNVPIAQAQSAPIAQGSKILLSNTYVPPWPGNTTQTRAA